MAKVYPKTLHYKGQARHIYQVLWRDPKKRGKDRRCTHNFPIPGNRERDRKTEREAQAFARKKERDVEQGILTVRSQSVTVAEAYDEYMRKISPKLREGSRRHYQYTADKHLLSDPIADRKLTDLTEMPDLLDEYMERVKAKRLSGIPTRVNTILHGIFKCGIKKGWVGHDPLKLDPLSLGEIKRKTIAIPEGEEVERLLSYGNQRPDHGKEWSWHMGAVLANLLAHTNMRRGEVAGLFWEDINWDTDEIVLRQQMTRWGLADLKTDAGYRSLPLPPSLREVLLWHAAWMASQGLEMRGPILRTMHGRPITPDALGAYWLQICKTVGLLKPNPKGGDPLPKYGMHKLRHKAITQLAAHNVHPAHMQKAAGHESWKTTSLYTHSEPVHPSVRHAVEAYTNGLTPTMLPGSTRADSLSAQQRQIAERAIEMKARGMSTNEVAAELGKFPAYIRKLIHRLNGTVPVGESDRNEQAAQIRVLRDQNMPVLAIADRLGLSAKTVRRRQLRAEPESQEAIEAREIVVRKTANADLVAQIRALRDQGLSLHAIAERLGVPKSTVHRRISDPECVKFASTGD